MSAHQFFAHSLKGRPITDWEPLSKHLESTAVQAEQFAAKFDAGVLGRQLGLWHDLGKFTSRFQKYLLEENGYEVHLEENERAIPRDHSTAGAKHAVDVFQQLPGQAAYGWLLAYAIAGHHTGLPDGKSDQSSCMADRIRKPDISWEGAPAELLIPLALNVPRPMTLLNEKQERAAFQIALFGRMLFSCLKDADCLATEAFWDPTRSRLRQGVRPNLSAFLAPLNVHLGRLAARRDENAVQACRQEILAACREAAKHPPGLFSLTVPTGGGKTLASLAFALEHARLHPEAKFERVVYAIPFTSIIEQTASTFSSVFQALGADSVLEHHSNLDPDERVTPLSQLATENWDAPLVVTTNVQLFESLFDAKPSKCRKLHRLVKSIIILDEVQTLPVDLLRPCLAVLRELAAAYECTIVLCTATQPALDLREDFKIGLKEVREIIANKENLYERMRRTKVEFLGRLTDADLLVHLGRRDQFLCIVNTRKHATQLYDLLRAGHEDPQAAGLFHLSTWMCGAHRSQIIQSIKERLKAGLPCRVVSTSLIEAGVDVDFPAVFRSLAGLDAIAQAAGRCNREGKNPTATVYVFEPADAGASPFVRSTITSTCELLPDHSGDLLSLSAIRQYFELHFWKHSNRWDAKKVMECFGDISCQTFAYREAAKRFQMIEEYERPIIVPWGKAGRDLVDQLKAAHPHDCWRLARRLQRYTVGVTPKCFEKMLSADIKLVREAEFGDRFPVLTNTAIYDDEKGILLQKMGVYDPNSLVCSG